MELDVDSATGLRGEGEHGTSNGTGEFRAVDVTGGGGGIRSLRK